MASPPTIAALATSSGITSGRYWPSTNGFQNVITEYWRYLGAARPTQYGPTNPDNKYVKFGSFTTYSGNPVGGYAVEFYHYGTQVEFLFKGLAGQHQILVDDELVQASPFSISNTGSQNYQLITFGAAAIRKIRFVGHNIPWGGIYTGPSDAVWATERIGPKVVVLGDSYTGGSNSAGNTVTSWVAHMAEILGWRDVESAFQGGTGYLNGSGPFSSRVANDVVANAPDIVIVAGGHNDEVHSRRQRRTSRRHRKPEF